MKEGVRPNAIYHVGGVARILSLQEPVVRKMIREGVLPATKLGKRRYWVRGVDLLTLVLAKLTQENGQA